jgi:hypothetical protein
MKTYQIKLLTGTGGWVVIASGFDRDKLEKAFKALKKAAVQNYTFDEV